MAVKIRLKRICSKKLPFYRIVVADSRNAVTGGIIEEIGTYNPVSEAKEVKLDADSAVQWLHNGAKPSDTVRKLLSDHGVMERFHNEKLENKKNN